MRSRKRFECSQVSRTNIICGTVGIAMHFISIALLALGMYGNGYCDGYDDATKQ